MVCSLRATVRQSGDRSRCPGGTQSHAAGSSVQTARAMRAASSSINAAPCGSKRSNSGPLKTSCSSHRQRGCRCETVGDGRRAHRGPAHQAVAARPTPHSLPRRRCRTPTAPSRRPYRSPARREHRSALGRPLLPASKRGHRRVLVERHQPRIPDHIGGQNGEQTAAQVERGHARIVVDRLSPRRKESGAPATASSSYVASNRSVSSAATRSTHRGARCRTPEPTRQAARSARAAPACSAALLVTHRPVCAKTNRERIASLSQPAGVVTSPPRGSGSGAWFHSKSLYESLWASPAAITWWKVSLSWQVPV